MTTRLGRFALTNFPFRQRRMDGRKRYFSDSSYNLNVGDGDINEIYKRRTWRTLDLWASDSNLKFGHPVLAANGAYRRIEYLYLGRTTPGKVTITDLYVGGTDAKYFKVDKSEAVLLQNQHVRVRVAFQSDTDFDLTNVDAYIQIKTDGVGGRRIKIVGVNTPSVVLAPTPEPTESAMPSATPSAIPSKTPTSTPSEIPSVTPSSQPSSLPSDAPSSLPSQSPSALPLCLPMYRSCSGASINGKCCGSLVCIETQSNSSPICMPCKKRDSECQKNSDCCGSNLCRKNGGTKLCTRTEVANGSNPVVAPGQAASRPTANKPTVTKPTINKPTVNKPTINKPTVNKPTANKPTVNKPTVDKPTMNKPTINKPTVIKPTQPKPSAPNPRTAPQPKPTARPTRRPTRPRPTVKPTMRPRRTPRPTTAEPTASVSPSYAPTAAPTCVGMNGRCNAARECCQPYRCLLTILGLRCKACRKKNARCARTNECCTGLVCQGSEGLKRCVKKD